MDVKRKSPTKEKRKNNEKRKEKSRDAARCRRSRETEIFTDLANSLPLQKDQISQLDKASIMRLAISYLRVQDLIHLVPEVKTTNKAIMADESMFLKSLEGFLLVLSVEGDFIYLSENVSDYIGIAQVDLLGQNVYDYSHPCDHDEIKDMLVTRQGENDLPKSFFIRLKCTLTSNGRSVNLKSATYKVIHCTGHMLHSKIKKEKLKTKSKNSNCHSIQRCLVAVGQPIPHPSNIEAPLGQNTFLSQHSLDMKFTYVDDQMINFLGYKSEDLIGKSIYEYYHAVDSDAICSAFKCVFSKGQCETNRYRFLARKGGYVWVMTQATLITDKMRKPQSVVCVNYVISGVECKDEIYSCAQSIAAAEETSTVKEEEVKEEEEIVVPACSPESIKSIVVNKEPSITVVSPSITVVSPKEVLPPLVELQIPIVAPPRPQTATSKLFAPRTEEMNKGFLMFSDEEPGLTMLKDEPDDLTHLAPVAGDVCVPLEDHPFLSDMLDDFLLKDNFSPLLTDEPADPFISYRDSCDLSPQMLSPNLSKHSESSLPSLNSPSGSLGDEDHMSTFMALNVEEDPDLLMKAPYIPMNIGDDLPLLMSDEFIWNTNTNEKITNSKNPNIQSSLAQLLCSNVNKQPCSKTNDHGGGHRTSDVTSDIYNEKKNWGMKTPQKTRLDRLSSNKRTSSSIYEISNKRCKNEPTKDMSPELMQHLMSENTQMGSTKGKSDNWLLDSGQKGTYVSQPHESVLMNLLTEENDSTRMIDKFIDSSFDETRTKPPDSSEFTSQLREKSYYPLNSDVAAITSLLLDLTDQDFAFNALVDNSLLQDGELMSALDVSETI